MGKILLGGAGAELRHLKKQKNSNRTLTALYNYQFIYASFRSVTFFRHAHQVNVAVGKGFWPSLHLIT